VSGPDQSAVPPARDPGQAGSGAQDLRTVLEDLAAGRTSVEQALRVTRLLSVAQLGEFARLDLGRHARKGVPEVVYSPGKADEAFFSICARLLYESGLVLASRVTPERAAALRARLETDGALSAGDEMEYDPATGVLEITGPRYASPEPAGAVGILTAGTSDVAVAEEAAVVARHMGCRLERAYDVGVAGVHRLLEPLAAMIAGDTDVLVVVAGMEGALPSVVAGLVDLPVIGVPTSTGYGMGGDGTAALLSMLQSCSPGLVAVNIDNGVGAGAAAALIARRSGQT